MKPRWLVCRPIGRARGIRSRITASTQGAGVIRRRFGNARGPSYMTRMTPPAEPAGKKPLLEVAGL